MNMFKNLKVRNKILLLLAIVVLSTLCPLLFVSYDSSINMSKKSALKVAEENFKILNLNMEIKKNELLKSLLLITVRNVPRKAIEENNFNVLREESIPKALNESADIFIILDQNKQIIADKNNSSTRYEDFKSFELLLDKAQKTNKPVFGYDVMKKEDLLNQSKELAEKIKITRKPTPGAKENFVNKTVEEDALVYAVVAPINSTADKEKIIGYAVSAFVFNNNFSMIDQIKKGDEGLDLTIFKDDLRVATTVITKENKRATGTLLSEKVVNKTLIDGENFSGKAMVVGKPYQAFYSPIKNIEGKNIGVLFSAISESSISNEFTNIFGKAILITLLLVCIILLPFIYYVTSSISNPVIEVVNSLNEMSKGNLAIKELKINSNDETGRLAKALNTTVINLKELISEVSRSAENISASSEEMSASAEQTTEGARQSAKSTSQLAVGTQEISRNLEDGASNVNKMNKAIQGISKEAKIVAEFGNDTETNAASGAEFVKKAIHKIDSIKKVSSDISVNMSELGSLSSEIEQIVDLIKNIAGQTNLLALNAAIEAARAGEHGKGFAVVADEVKKLAGQSAEATEKITAMIKEIQNKTASAVLTVDKAAHEVEEGVIVINDAGVALENIIKQVKSANSKIQEITKEIDGVADNSEELVKVIESISAITEETAAGAEEISSITKDQTASLEEISTSSQMLASIAEKLTSQVEFFKT